MVQQAQFPFEHEIKLYSLMGKTEQQNVIVKICELKVLNGGVLPKRSNYYLILWTCKLVNGQQWSYNKLLPKTQTGNDAHKQNKLVYTVYLVAIIFEQLPHVVVLVN